MQAQRNYIEDIAREEAEKLAKILQDQKKLGRTSTLNIYSPGTGETSKDLSINPYKYIHSGLLALINLNGVGTKRDSNPLSLKTEKIKQNSWSFSSFFTPPKVSSAECVDDLAGLNSTFLEGYGIITGRGELNNIKLVLTILSILETQEILPEKLVLIGFSRGACQNIALANEAYIKFGQKIKEINYFGLDPVPGPLRHHDKLKRVFPPNAKSILIAYTTNTESQLFAPLDWRSIIGIHPNQTITSFAVKSKHTEISQYVMQPVYAFAKYHCDDESFNNLFGYLSRWHRQLCDSILTDSKEVSEQNNIISQYKLIKVMGDDKTLPFHLTLRNIMGMKETDKLTQNDIETLSKCTDKLQATQENRKLLLKEIFNYHKQSKELNTTVLMKNQNV